MSDDYFYLGKITKVFGLKGELMVYIDADEPEKYHNLELVYFEIEEEPIPFFIQSVKIKSSHQLIVKFDDIDLASAPNYINTSLFLPIKLLPPLENNQFYFHEIKGFTIVDIHYGTLGICNNILEYPHQAIFQIKHKKGEILVPVVDAYISKVDKEKKIIEIETPPGLIDIYIQ